MLFFVLNSVGYGKPCYINIVLYKYTLVFSFYTKKSILISVFIFENFLSQKQQKCHYYG